jgi:hypothetical protein
MSKRRRWLLRASARRAPMRHVEADAAHQQDEAKNAKLADA